MKGKLTDHMNKAREKRLTLIADLYTNKKMTMQDIASKLDISRQRVGKILQNMGLRP